MNAKLTINDTEFDFNGNKLKLKCNQNSNLNIKNIAKFDNLNANSIRINNFNISGNSNNIEIEYTGNASVNISYNAINDIQHSSIYKEPCIMQTENPLLTQNNNINLLMDENITDPVSKLIETNRKAKRERMQKFGIIVILIKLDGSIKIKFKSFKVSKIVKNYKNYIYLINR